MKTKTLLSILTFVLFLSSFSQKPTMELAFTAENDGQHISLNSILIENLTQGGDTTLYTPDSVLLLDYVASIWDNRIFTENTFSVSQNYPNPSKGKTIVNLHLPAKEYIKISVLDNLGRVLTCYENTLKYGTHTFTFYGGSEKFYILKVTGKHTRKTLKMLNTKSNSINGRKSKIIYNGYEANVFDFKSQNAITGFVFNLGDELKYTAFSDIGERTIFDSPTGNQTYTFLYTVNPCPSTPTVTYEGQVYNTVLIGSQCWLAENLNVGTMINGNQNQQNNDTIEKHCYSNDPANCDTYGGHYEWNELMEYTTIQGVQGICPPDWHLPTDEEWKQLEGVVDSQYGYPDPEWDNTGYRGFDAGLNLRSTTSWNVGGNGTNEYGFTALPGGYATDTGGSWYLGEYGFFFTSSEHTTTSAWCRTLGGSYGRIQRTNSSKSRHYSVRCIKD